MNEPKRKNDTGASSMAMVARYLGLAFLIPMSAGAGYALGTYLDKTLHTGFLSITCLILGIVGSFVQLMRELLRDADKQ